MNYQNNLFQSFNDLEQDDLTLQPPVVPIATLDSCAEDSMTIAADPQRQQDESVIRENKLMRNIDGEVFFTEKFPLRMDLKHVHVVDIENLDVVLVSTFHELYGLPYLVMEQGKRKFRGKVYMT